MTEPDGILAGHVLCTVDLATGTASGTIDLGPYVRSDRRYRLDAFGIVLERETLDLTDPMVDQYLTSFDRKCVATLTWAGMTTEPILTRKGQPSRRADKLPVGWDGRIDVYTNALTGGAWYTDPFVEYGWAWVEVAWWLANPVNAGGVAARCAMPW